MKKWTRPATAAITAVALLAAGATAAPAAHDPTPEVTPLTSGIAGANGSTIGPDGALYVTESATGSILRIDRHTGDSTVWATGLPTAVAPIGGPMDVIFKGDTAYVLVSLVGSFFGNDAVNGIYRVDGPDEFTIIADLGQWAIDNPPGPDLEWEIPTGVHYAIEHHRHGFVVSEAHHNKLIHVARDDGEITLLAELGNVVPAGLERSYGRVFTALTGAVPHLPEDGQIAELAPGSHEVEVIASGAPLMLDVERGRGGRLYGLAQGDFTPGQPPGAPADPNTGQLVLVDGEGGVQIVVDGLHLPVSMEIVGDTAYVVGLTGDVVRVDGLR